MVEKITLDNGVRIVHERLEHLRSCALGIWVESGSRHEPEELCGTIHYLISDAAKFVTGTVAVVDGGFNTFAM